MIGSSWLPDTAFGRSDLDGTRMRAPDVPIRRELTALALLVTALVSWSLVTELFAGEVGYHGFWWPPTAAVVLFVIRPRSARWTLPAAAVALWATGTAGPEQAVLGDPLPVAALVVGLGLGLGLLRLAQRHLPEGGPGEVAVFVVGTVLLGPVVGRLLGGGGVGLALADAAAALAIVPLVVGVTRRGAGSEPWRCAALLGVVGAGTAVFLPAATAAGETAMLLPVPLLAAAVLCGRRGTSAVALATGAALATGGSASGAGQVATSLTAVYVAGVACALVIAAMRTRAEGNDAPGTSPVLQSVEVDLPSPTQHARRLARLLRRARLATIAATAVAVGAAQVGLLPVHGGVSAFTVLVAVAGPYLLVNALSEWLDARAMSLEDRDLVESVADAAAVWVAHVALSVLLPEVLLQASTVWVALLAGLRLRTHQAIGVGGGYLVVAVVTWAVLPLPAPTAAATGLVTVLLTVLGAVFAGVTVHLVVRQLDDARRQATAAAVDLDRLQLDLAESEAALREEHAAALRQEHRLAGVVGELAAANEELEQARASLERFTAVLAHDLRSPLASTEMAARTLAHPELTEPMAERVRGGLVRTAGRAVRLVDQLYSHATAASTELERAMTDLNDVARGVLDALSAGIAGSGAEVRQRGLLATVVCDEVLVGQLLQNLVANALHHATVDGAGPIVTIAGQWRDDGYVLTVCDDGPGFPDGVVDLFTPGVRGGTGGHEGLGLGLATCREIAERHGGRIWAENSPEGGASFRVLLPAAPPDVVHLLVVEDDDDLRMVYRHALTAQVTGRTEVVVTEAATLAEARRLLADGGPHPFDAALVDVELPDGYGTELIDGAIAAGVPMHIVTGRHRDAVARLDDARALGIPITRKSEVLGQSGPELRSRLLGSVA